MKRIVILALMVLIGGYGAAQAEAPKVSETETATKDFLGLKWGLGVGVTGSFGGDTPVEKASVVGKDMLVRVDEEGDFRPQVFLEMHVFIGKKASCWREYQKKMSTWREEGKVSPSAAQVSLDRDGKTKETICPEWKLDAEPLMPDPLLRGFGPFVAVQGSDNKPIDAFALGFMWGFRKDAKASSSVNIGVGLSFDPSVQVLGNGVKEGQKLPDGETAVRFKKEGRFGWVVMTSFTF